MLRRLALVGILQQRVEGVSVDCRKVLGHKSHQSQLDRCKPHTAQTSHLSNMPCPRRCLPRQGSLATHSSQPSFSASYAINEDRGPLYTYLADRSPLKQAPTRKGYLPVSMMNRMSPQLQMSTASPL